MKKLSTILKMILVSLVAIQLFPTSALADVTVNNVFTTPGSEDIFLKMLAFLMPNAGPIPSASFTNPSHTAIKNAFMVFSGILLVIGSMTTGWQIVSSLVASAKEGTALGKNYHEVWAPIRLAIGFGSLVPAVQGLCAAQIIVLYLITWGGNIANLVLTSYIDTLTVTNSQASDPGIAQAIRATLAPISSKIAKDVFQKELCSQTLNLLKTKASSSGLSIPKEAQSSTIAINNPSWADATSAKTNLGTIQTVYKSSLDYGSFCGQIYLSYDGPAQNIGSTDTSTSTNTYDAQAMLSTEKTNIDTIRNVLSPLAGQAAQTYIQSSGGTSMPAFSVGGAADGYKDSVINSMNTYIQAMTAADLGTITNTTDLSALKSDVSSKGWAIVGSLYLTIAKTNASLFSTIGQSYSSSGLNTSAMNTLSDDWKKTLYGNDATKGVLTGFEVWWLTNIGTITAGSLDDSGTINSTTSTNSSSASEFDAGIKKAFGDGFASELAPDSASDQDIIINPMMQMVNYGTKLMVIGTAGLGTYLLFGAAAEATDGSGATVFGFLGWSAASKPLAWTAMVIAYLVLIVSIVLLATGALHVYILPMIPYILVLFFTVGMLTLTVEALVAAPLWAFFHIRMDGQEFVDNVQKPGYMIAFNLILRPVLMVFGFMLSLIVFGIMLWLVAKTFTSATDSLQKYASTGWIASLFMLVLQSIIDYQIAIKSFHLITEIPDRVTRWFGQAGERLGEEEHSKHVTGVIAGSIENRTQSAVQGALNTRVGQRSASLARGGGDRTAATDTSSSTPNQTALDTRASGADENNSGNKKSSAGSTAASTASSVRRNLSPISETKGSSEG